MNKGIKWRVGKGDKIQFWMDKWHLLEVLKNWTLNPVTTTEDELKIDFFLEDYGWNFEELHKVLPAEIVLKIVPIYAGRMIEAEDTEIWGANNNDNFSLSLMLQ